MSFFDDITGGVGGMLGSFLHPEKGYQAAEDEARRGWNEAKGFETPIFNQGQEQYPFLNKAAGELMNPQELQNKWINSYSESPWAKRELDMNSELGEEEASRMGLMGSSGALQNVQRGAGDIVSKDRQEFLNDLMQKFMQGIGLRSGIYDTGAQMAGALGGHAMDQGTTMANLRYGEVNSPGKLMENMLRLAAQAYGASHGVGAGAQGA